MTNSDNLETYCRNCISRDFVSGRGLVCKRTSALPEFDEECEHYQLDDKLEAMAPPPDPTIFEGVLTQEQLLAEENLPKAFLCGAMACVVGAAAWALVSVSTGYQVGYMAIGIGFLVGLVMRFGKGVRPIFGIIGAALALLSCLLGDYFSMIGYVAKEYNLSYIEALTTVPVADVVEALKDNLLSMTALFYGIAVYNGYKLSFRKEKRVEGGQI